MSELTVRKFEDRDVEAFIGMGQWLQENSHFKDCGFSRRRMLELFAQIMMNPNYFGVIAETKDGKVVGCFVANLQKYYFSDERLAVDLCFGILPEYRDNAAKTIKIMLREYEAWAKAAGAIETTMSTSTGAHGDKLEKYLNLVGYNTVGFTTKKRIG